MSKESIKRLAALILGSILALAALPILAVGLQALKDVVTP